MQSKTSSSEVRVAAPCPYFNGTLFWKNLSRFWPLWAVYLAAWLVMGPLAQFIELYSDYGRMLSREELFARSADLLLNMGTTGGLVMAVGFGCLFAMALFSYLCSARSVGMMHSFPIRREGLFLVNYLSGAGVALFTLVLTAVLTGLVQAPAGAFSGKNLLVWFACAAGQMLFFYSFAVFCAMFTGQLLAIPVFYGVGNVLALTLNLLVQNVASTFFYGYNGGSTPMWVRWLTPVWQLETSLRLQSDYNPARYYNENYRLEGLSTVAVYAAVGVVFALLGLLVYRLRRSETAGDTVTVGWLRPVFSYGVGACFALSLGQGLYFLVFEQFRNNPQPSMVELTGCMILLGLVGYFGAEMLLRKSFRVFKKAWVHAAILSVVVVAFGVCVSLDVTGVETRMPETGAVERIEFSVGGQNHCSASIEDPALIEQLRQVHQALIDEKEVQLDWQRRTWDNDELLVNYAYFDLTYILENGTQLARGYSLRYSSEDLSDPNSAVAELAALVAEPQVQRESLLGDRQIGRLTSAELSYLMLSNSGGYNYDYVSFDAAAAETLFAALQKDLDAGNFGRNQLNPQKWAQETYRNELTLYYTDPKNPDDSYSIYFQFSSNCTALIAALKETGLVTEGMLTTEAQMQDWDSGEYVYEKPYDMESQAEIVYPEAAVIGGADGPTSIYVG